MEGNTEPLIGFSIKNTLDMGVGNAELLNDLFTPETATGAPEDITPIVKEVEDVSLGKPKEISKEVVKETNENESNKQALISSFLGDEEEEETDKELEEKKQFQPEGKEEENSDNSSSQFTALARDLTKLGVFTNEDGEEETEINTPEDFLEKFNSEKKKGSIEMVDNFLSQFGEDYKNAFEAIYVKGVDPKEYFSTYNNVVGFAEMDLTNEANQIKIMKQALSDQGFESEDLDTEIERLQNYGDLETVATKHHKILVKKEAAKLNQLEVEAEQDLQYKTSIRNKYISNVQEILAEKIKTKEFDGIPLNPKLASELQDFLLVNKWKTPSGETLSDFDRTILDLKKPENHAMKVKVGLLLKILEKDPTLSSIQNKGVTKKSNELFSEVARHVTKDKTPPSTKQNVTSWFT